MIIIIIIIITMHCNDHHHHRWRLRKENAILPVAGQLYAWQLSREYANDDPRNSDVCKYAVCIYTSMQMMADPRHSMVLVMMRVCKYASMQILIKEIVWQLG